MTHGSLFSGIGGFDLAAEWMGWENKFHCEWNEFGQRVLNYYWPDAELFTDITKSDFKKYANTIDVLTGGFPCQPYSSAGKRLGKEDERHLWPEMLRCIREIAPRYVVGENVRGLTNWNGGLVFDEVCADLENLGYQVAPFIIPASAVNAPHQRERVWFVAYSDFNGQLEKRRYDWSSENADGSNATEFRATDTKDFDRCNSNANAEGESCTCNGTCSKRICEKNQTTNTNGVCRMDQNIGNKKGISNEIEPEIDYSGTLVSNGSSGVQLPIVGGLANNQDELYSANRNGLQNDLSGIKGMEGNASNSDSNGFNECDSEHEKYSSKTRFDAFDDVNENDERWDVANSDSTSPQCRDSETAKERKEQSRRIESFNKYSSWQIFPSQSPICGGDDGLPTELDGITFSKWRNESIKAYGNAIVPQVVYQIFKAIEQYERNL
jgi:DNA-cytosine methyltransferase